MKIEKTIALGIVAIFLISLVPAALAVRLLDTNAQVSGNAHDSVESNGDNVSADTNTGANANLNAGRGRNAHIKDILKERKKELKDDLKEIKKARKVKNAEELNERNVSESKLKILRERFEVSKEKFDEAKKDLKDERENLKEALKNKDRNATFVYAKNYLLNSVDLLISDFENIKVKVQENANIGNETEAGIVADIDAQIKDLQDIKARISSATTNKELKDIAKELHEKLNKLKNIISLHTNRIVLARVEGIINNGLVLEKRLDKLLEKAKNQSIDVNVTTEVDLFKSQIADSRDKYKQAQAKISEAIDLRTNGEPAESEKIKSLMQEAHDLLADSRNSLKDAYQTLKEIMKKIKDKSRDLDLSKEVDVEVDQDAHTSINGASSQTGIAGNASGQASA